MTKANPKQKSNRVYTTAKAKRNKRPDDSALLNEIRQALRDAIAKYAGHDQRLVLLAAVETADEWRQALWPLEDAYWAERGGTPLEPTVFDQHDR